MSKQLQALSDGVGKNKTESTCKLRVLSCFCVVEFLHPKNYTAQAHQLSVAQLVRKLQDDADRVLLVNMNFLKTYVWGVPFYPLLSAIEG